MRLIKSGSARRRHRAKRPRHVGWLRTILIGTVLGSTFRSGVAIEIPSEAIAVQADATVVKAVWKQQDIRFFFTSRTTFYSCYALDSKITRLLVALGAHPSIKVRTSGCEFGNSISRLPIVHIDVTTPFEATPDLLSELEKTRPTRELTARVRGEPVDVDPQFPARWQAAPLSMRKVGFESGDCELMEQLQRQVLPKLAVRIVKPVKLCSRDQFAMGRRLDVALEALTAVPAGKPEPIKPEPIKP